jgi:L-histidine N-alpha-methyltransferase
MALAVAVHPSAGVALTGEAALAMAGEVRASLTARPRSLPSKYFYDDRGSDLFEQITRLPEYYQTRTELSLLGSLAGDLVARLRPSEIVELGSGAGRKIRVLLDAARRAGSLPRLTLFDINHTVLRESAQQLRRDYEGLDVRTLVGDFAGDLQALGTGSGRLVVFFGGTIGNFAPAEVPGFLRRAAQHLGSGDALLVGVDTVKDRARIEAAYNDAAGVTAAFNLNILAHLNHALGATFDLGSFAHLAFWSERDSWIEMRLVATRTSRVHVPLAGLDLMIECGEEIRTEISCKYTEASFAALARGSGLVLDTWFTDPDHLFALALLRRTDA